MISTHHLGAATPTRLATGWRTFDVADVASLSWLMLAGTWSPIVWRDGHRNSANFMHADFLGLDFEDPQFSLADAYNTFAGMTYVLGTTRNHQREKEGVTCDRFRVVIPFSARITDVETYKHNVCQALKFYDHADQSCKDGARTFFACREILRIEPDGDAWDVETPPIASAQKVSTGRLANGLIPLSSQLWLRKYLVDEPIPKGTIQTTMHGLGCALCRYDFPLDEALALVAASPTMVGFTDERDREVCRRAVRNGYKTVGKMNRRP